MTADELDEQHIAEMQAQIDSTPRLAPEEIGLHDEASERFCEAPSDLRPEFAKRFGVPVH